MKGRIIAIDYGQKRTGIAWTDPLQIIASPVECIETPKLKNWLIQTSQTETFTELVLGYPTQWNQKDNTITQEVRNFYEWLRKQFPHVNVHLWDEKFTSTLATKLLIEGNFPKKKRSDKKLVNAIAANIILQEFLEYRKNHLPPNTL